MNRCLSLRRCFVFLSFVFPAGNLYALVTIDFVDVGDPGNAEHLAIMLDGTTGYGAVDYTFRMGEFEVTNDQYAEFLNAVAVTDTYELYYDGPENSQVRGIDRTGSPGNYFYFVKPNFGNKPVNYLSWFSAARFTNWLHNGQPSGLQDATTTEDGAYTFTGLETLGPRNPGALYHLPNEHEWHKAAFYEPGAVTGDGDEWWFYGNRSDLNPPPQALATSLGDVSNPGPQILVHSRTANWNGTTTGNVITVGSAGSQSYYGAKDMSGNVFEWVEADPNKPDPFFAGLYVTRGGSYFSGFGHMRSTERNNGPKIGDGETTGLDFLVWQQETTGALTSMFADFDADGDVDTDDLDVWQTSLGVDDGADADIGGHYHNMEDAIHKANGFRVAAPALPLLTVPEPTSAVLVLAAVLSVALRRRSQRI